MGGCVEAVCEEGDAMAASFDHGYALLIGVGKCVYPKLSLPVTVQDMQALRRILVDSTLCAYANDEQHVRLLHDEKATRKAILDHLAWLQACAAADPDATVIVFYSGHGLRDEFTEQYYLIPHDFQPSDREGSGVKAEEFDQALRRIAARRLLVCIDSCHAEGMAEAKEEAVDDALADLDKSAPPKRIIDALKEGEGRAVFTSSRGRERSYIRPDNTLSLYTYHLIEALQGAGNQTGDTVVRVSNLMNYLSKTVPASAAKLVQAKQTPFFDTAAEDFPVAILRGGKGLPAGGWDAVAEEAAQKLDEVTAQFTITQKVEGNQNVVAGRDITGSTFNFGDPSRRNP
jgi:uncharacterized caspase-like protein